MKRIMIFVLLCMAVFTVNAAAWAFDTPILAPLVSSDGNGSEITSSDLKIDTRTKGSGNSFTDPFTIYITGFSNIQEHTATSGDTQKVAKWVGVAIKSSDFKGATYIQGWEKDLQDMTSATEWNSGWDGMWGGDNDNDYLSLYWGIKEGSTPGFFVVSDDTGKLTYFKIVWGAYQEDQSTTPQEESNNNEEPAPEPTEDIAKQNEDMINSLVEDDASQETKDAADAAIKAFAEAETGDHVLTEDEAKAMIKNQQEIAQQSTVEAETREVVDATVPAASNLLEDSAIAELDTLSAKPKVTEPAPPSPEEQQQIVETLTNIEDLRNDETADTSDIPDTFDISELRDSGAKLSDGRDTITIDKAEKSLEKQASLIEELFDKIKDVLTSVIQGSGDDDKADNGVVIATMMPPMTPNVTGWFPLKVNMRHLMPGQRPRFWVSPGFFRTKASATGSEASLAGDLASSGTEGDAFFLDADGKPTTIIQGDPENMTVVAYLLENENYDSAFITVDASEADKKKLDDLIAAEDNKDEDVDTSSGSGGGCNSVRSEAGAPLAELGVRSVLLLLALFSLAFVKISLKR